MPSRTSYKTRCRNCSYEGWPRECPAAAGGQCRGVAREMSEPIPFVHVRKSGDLDRAGGSLTAKRPVHVFVGTTDSLVLDELRRACEAHLVYGVYVTRATFEVEMFSMEFDAIPLFVVIDESAAVTTAKRLVRDPYGVVLEALNGEAVAARYGRGSPS
jgi:hypothetical protein